MGHVSGVSNRLIDSHRQSMSINQICPVPVVSYVGEVHVKSVYGPCCRKIDIQFIPHFWPICDMWSVESLDDQVESDVTYKILKANVLVVCLVLKLSNQCQTGW